MILSNHSIISMGSSKTNNEKEASSSSASASASASTMRRRNNNIANNKVTDDNDNDNDTSTNTDEILSESLFRHFDHDDEHHNDDEDHHDDHNDDEVEKEAMKITNTLSPSSSPKQPSPSPTPQQQQQQQVTTTTAGAQSSEYVVPKLCPKTIQEVRSSFTTSTISSTTSSAFGRNLNNNTHLQKYLARKNKRVRFKDVTIRRYCMILGDNPSVHIGPPISIGWEYDELPTKLDITAYERTRKKQRRTGKLSNLIINYHQRYELLLRLGFDEIQINKAEKDADKIRWKRSITRSISQIPMICKMEEITQSFTRKVKRIVTIGRRRR